MTANSDFNAFIEEQTARPAGEPDVDWEQEREEWLQYLDQFYRLVEEFMGEYVNRGKVGLRRSSKTLNEEFIGEYSAATMAMDIGRNSIIFDPVGTNLIGVKGRVDMRGAKGVVKFVLVPEDAAIIGWQVHVTEGADPVPDLKPAEPVDKWTWKIATPPPQVRCVELRRHSFQDAVMQVVNG